MTLFDEKETIEPKIKEFISQLSTYLLINKARLCSYETKRFHVIFKATNYQWTVPVTVSLLEINKDSKVAVGKYAEIALSVLNNQLRK